VPVIAVPGTPLLTDALWDRLRPLLPVPAPRGRPQAATRPLLAGLLWLMHTGASWRAIPAAYGPWPTVHSRYQRWRRTGVWAQIAAVLCDEAGPSAPARR
jgi:transposase